MSNSSEKKVPVLLWPFYALWRLVVKIIELSGRLVGAILGLVLMVVGVILSLTIVGAIVGVPLIVFAGMLMIRSIF